MSNVNDVSLYQDNNNSILVANSSNIYFLSDEILVYILSFLPKTASSCKYSLVCKKFYYLLPYAIALENSDKVVEFKAVMFSASINFQRIINGKIDGFKPDRELMQELSGYVGENGQKELLTAILTVKTDASKEKILTTIFYHACQNGNEALCKKLLNDNLVNPEADDNEAIVIACQYSRINIVELLFNYTSVDPQVDHNAPFRLACENGNVKMVEFLLNSGRINPNDTLEEGYGSALTLATLKNQVEVVDILLKAKIPPTQDVFYMACQNGCVEIVNLFLQQSEIDPIADDNEGLRLACYFGHFKAVKFLLNDKRIFEAAHFPFLIETAVRQKHFHIAKFLVGLTNQIAQSQGWIVI